MAGEGTLTKMERQHYEHLLQKEKERILRAIGVLKEDTTGKDEGGIPTHIADLGTDVFEKNLELDLTNSEGKILQAIGEALERINAEEFGTCELCGKTIPKNRLEALPYARYCIECQREKEKSGE